MNFRLYPFDTQECRFTINARMNIDYMVETDNIYQISKIVVLKITYFVDIHNPIGHH